MPNPVDVEILRRAGEDWIEPWLVVRLFEDRGLPADLADECARWTVVGLLAVGLLDVGTIQDGAFVPRPEPAGAVARHVLDEWRALHGRAPDIGDIGFLDLTPAGETWAGLRA